MATPYTPKEGSAVGRFFRGTWHALDLSRRIVLNGLFLILLIALVAAILVPKGPKLQEKTALVLDIKGKIVEQTPGGLRQKLMGQASGDSDDATQLRDILAALDAAAKDSKIDRVLLLTDDLSGGGLSSLREVAAAIERFKASGKQVVAWAGSYDQRAYYLAAHASEVYMHPMGMVALEGYGRYRNYYKDAFDRVGISANVIRVGTYKNAGEPYFTNAPSAATLESEGFLFNDIWQTYVAGVEKARKFPAGSITKGIENIQQLLTAAGGDTAKLALDGKWVDALKTRDQLRALLMERGAKDEEKKTFRQISLSSYLQTIKPKSSGDAVGIIVAQGEILDGSAPAGKIGGKSTAELIRKARDDDKIKAVVLRVNSPGGSAFGSELIRRELELTQKAGKPVVVSMGDVAASGGYWISMSADEVIADAATITGSIGVFGMLPTAEKAMEKISVNTGGVHTTWLGGAYDPRRPLDPKFADLVQTVINRIYTDFTTAAAKARKTTPDKIDAVAQGRVWTGSQAKERGLIDRTGSFADAIKSAKTKAKLSDDVRVTYVEQEGSRFEKLLQGLAAEASATLAKHVGLTLVPVGVPSGVALDAQRELAWLTEAAQNNKHGAFAVMAHCLCDR